MLIPIFFVEKKLPTVHSNILDSSWIDDFVMCSLFFNIIIIEEKNLLDILITSRYVSSAFILLHFFQISSDHNHEMWRICNKDGRCSFVSQSHVKEFPSPQFIASSFTKDSTIQPWGYIPNISFHDQLTIWNR